MAAPPDAVKPMTSPREACIPREGLALLSVLILAAVIEWTPGLREVFAPWNRLNAELFASALQLTGLTVAVSDAVMIDAGGFRASIVYGCTGFVPGLIVVAWILGLRQQVALKLAGIVSGLLWVTCVNLVRVLVAFHVAVHNPQHLPLVHEVLGHGAVVLSTVAFLILWHRIGQEGRLAGCDKERLDSSISQH